MRSGPLHCPSPSDTYHMPSGPSGPGMYPRNNPYTRLIQFHHRTYQLHTRCIRCRRHMFLSDTSTRWHSLSKSYLPRTSRILGTRVKICAGRTVGGCKYLYCTDHIVICHVIVIPILNFVMWIVGVIFDLRTAKTCRSWPIITNVFRCCTDQ